MSVSNEQLQALIETNRDTSVFINAAQILVDQMLASKNLSCDVSDQIVLFLAAHFAVLSEESGGLKRTKLGESDDSFRVPGEKDTGLKSTRFGQQAMIFDYTGTLAALNTNGGLKARFELVSYADDGNW